MASNNFRSIKLGVGSLQEGSDFYVQQLGMVEGAHHNKWEWSLSYPDEPTAASIVLYHDPDHDLPYEVGPSWMVFNVEDAAAKGAELKALGLPVEDPVARPDYGVTYVMAQDPWGNVVELISQLD